VTISVPPGVSIKKEILQEGQVYVFRHSELGQLGRIVVQALPNDQSHFSCELSGDPDDSTTARRQAVFVPLCEQIIDAMEATLGKGSLDGAIAPSTPRDPTEVV